MMISASCSCSASLLPCKACSLAVEESLGFTSVSEPPIKCCLIFGLYCSTHTANVWSKGFSVGVSWLEPSSPATPRASQDSCSRCTTLKWKTKISCSKCCDAVIRPNARSHLDSPQVQGNSTAMEIFVCEDSASGVLAQ